MGRASGKASRRPPRAGEVLTPDEQRDIGQSPMQDPAGSPIPGLTGNIVNYETVRQEVPVPEPRAQNAGWMAHGVPPEQDTTEERAQSMRGGDFARRGQIHLEKPLERPVAVPVYIVEAEGGSSVIRCAYPRHITVPNSAADPVRICGRNGNRNRIGLLNEDTATNIRFAQRPSDLGNGGGALLPWPNTSYMWFETQDELYAVTVSSTLSVVMSVIEEFSQEL